MFFFVWKLFVQIFENKKKRRILFSFFSLSLCKKYVGVLLLFKPIISIWQNKIQVTLLEENNKRWFCCKILFELCSSLILFFILFFQVLLLLLLLLSSRVVCLSPVWRSEYINLKDEKRENKYWLVKSCSTFKNIFVINSNLFFCFYLNIFCF